MKILYAFQGTGNGHVARARDLVPRFSEHAQVDVLVAGTQCDLDLGFPIAYKMHGLSMIYDSKGAVSYWKSLLHNKPLRFLKDVLSLPVKQYDAVLIDFEAVASYACKLRGVKSLQLSHQAAYWSKKTPRPIKQVIHWEWVIANMSPSTYSLGFHFEPYDSFVLPPIIRKDIRSLPLSNLGHYTVYLPSYSAEEIVAYLQNFPSAHFHVFSRVKAPSQQTNVNVFPVGVQDYLKSFSSSTGLICGAGFEAPAEALFCGKKVMVSPIKGQYEQAANAVAAQRLGVKVFTGLEDSQRPVWEEFLRETTPEPIKWKDYAADLVQCIVKNVSSGNEYDDISSLEVW